MTEEVLIKIELEKGDGERQVDAMTKKITELTNATADLKKQNNDLIKAGKQNSQEYIENTRQIEINKQKINEASASRKGLIQTILAEDNSIKALQVRNAELIKQRNLLSTSTAEGREKIAEINRELDKNNETITANSSALEKQKFNIGNYKSALDGIVPGLGGFIDGIQGATKAGLAFIATPIGLVLAAVGAALFALTSYFKGSEEGQNRLNKIVAVGSAIMEQFMNVVEAAGKFLFEAFSNPKQAIIDFANLVKDNIINRFEGLLELIPNLGKAISLLFEGEFVEAGKLAFDSVVKVATGIEDASGKIQGFVEETGRLVEEGIKNGERLADLQAKIDRDERALIVERARSAKEVGKLREEAITQEADLKRKTIQEAIALEEELAKKETAFAKTKLEQAELIRDANGDDKEALKAVAQARADLFTAEASAFAGTLKFRKQLQALDEEEAKKRQEAIKEEIQIQKDIQAAEEEQFENNIKALEAQNEARLTALKEQFLNGLIAKEEFEAQFSTIELNALEQRKAFFVANGEDIVAIEATIVDRKIKERDREAAAEKKLADEKDKVRKSELKGQAAAIDAGVQLAKDAFGENKAISAAEVIINTIRAVQRAYADFPFPYSLIVSGLMGAAGAVNVAKILGVQFANGGLVKGFAGGGLSGTRIGAGMGMPVRMSNCDNLLATVRTGEVILNERQQAALGGSDTFRRIGVPGFAGGGGFAASTQTRASASQAQNNSIIQDTVRSIMSSMPPIVVTVEDINAKQEEVSFTTQKAQVIGT